MRRAISCKEMACEVIPLHDISLNLLTLYHPHKKKQEKLLTNITSRAEKIVKKKLIGFWSKIRQKTKKSSLRMLELRVPLKS